MANHKCAAASSDEDEPPELPRAAPHPSSKPLLDPFFSAKEAAAGPALELKSLQRERMLYKQRLQSGRSPTHKEGGGTGWASERTACQPGPQDREEVPPFDRRREHSKTSIQMQSLPTQVLLLCQDSEEPRLCPSPVLPPQKRLLYPGSSRISPVKAGNRTIEWSPIKTQKGPRAGLAKVPLASWLRGVHMQKAK